MPKARYSLVAYVNDPVGEFVARIRRKVHPDLPHLPAHLTVLPPRFLPGSDSSALETLEEVCSQVEPFEVVLGEVETFIPVTPTVFIRVSCARPMLDLHAQLQATHTLDGQEEWPYLPHMTIVKMTTEAQAQEAYQLARRGWVDFECCRTILVKHLSFVREQPDKSWIDVAEVVLGQRSVSSSKR
jgi:2'-5' RNA ligase